MNFLIWLVTGIFIGWAASKVFDRERSLLGYLGVGIFGSYLGGFIFNALNIKVNGYIGSVITSIIGAVILIFVMTKLRERKKRRKS